MVEEVARGRKDLLERIEKLERRVEELQQPRFKGTYQRALPYRAGSEVIADGSLWVAVTEVRPNQ